MSRLDATTGESMNGGLPEHYLFDSLDAPQRRKLSERLRTRRLSAGETLFAQGDPASHFWWLERGQIKLYRLSRGGHQKVMGLAEPGQTFAEGVLFMETPRYPVNAEAIVPSSVLGIERETYLAILETSFPTCRNLFRQMVQRTQRHLDEIEALTIQNARHRLANYLLKLQGADGGGSSTIKLPTRNVLIASQLAIQPETLSRLLRDLEHNGLIRVRGDRIELMDAGGLRDLLD